MLGSIKITSTSKSTNCRIALVIVLLLVIVPERLLPPPALLTQIPFAPRPEWATVGGV
ncbi:MAG: hypothetical protein V4773_31020 [Verrucomicrobiota bacterium]